MAYSSNYKPTLAETGEYEATIVNADVKTTGNGNQYFNIVYRLDNNIVTSEKIWRDSFVPTDFNQQRIADLLAALEINDEIEGDFALIQAIKNKKLIVSITKEFSDKLQREVNNVKGYKKIEEEELPF